MRMKRFIRKAPKDLVFFILFFFDYTRKCRKSKQNRLASNI